MRTNIGIPPISPGTRKTTVKTSRLYIVLFFSLLVLTLQYARLYSWFQSTADKSAVVISDETLSLAHLQKDLSRLEKSPKPGNRPATDSQQDTPWNTTTSNDRTTRRTIDPKFQNFQRYQSFPTAQELTSSCPPRLEFLHIPKAAGTTIERHAYKQANLAWGSCKFHFNYKKRWPMCLGELQPIVPFAQWPSHDKMDTYWHLPLHYLEEYISLPANPYHHVVLGNSSDKSPSLSCSPQEQPVHFFVVVRNPYDRAISEYYYRADFFHQDKKEMMHNPWFMNGWIKNRLKDVQNNNWTQRVRFTHWIPQSEFIFDHKGQRRVRHVLRYEQLDTDFAELMQKYGLNITMKDPAGFMSKSGKVQARMGPQHLNEAVLGELERHFANDFALGPYPFYDGPVWNRNNTESNEISTPIQDHTPQVLVPDDFERYQDFPTKEELGSSCPPRLVFLHIPKTGGSTIERTAFQQANLAWGCCQFHLHYGEKPWTGVCPLEITTPTPLDQWPSHKKLINLWHYPLHWLESNRTQEAHPMPSNPYYNVAADDTTTTSTECPIEDRDMHFFAVVRNPYTRAISEFYFQAGFAVQRKVHVLEDKRFMNRWIADKLTRYQARLVDPDLGWSGKMVHWIPQSEYIFDDQGRRRVRHVLKFENLTAEFNDLVQRYHLNLTLLDTKIKSGSVAPESRLGPEDLTVPVRTQLERHFAGDFKLGKYPLFRP